MLIELHRAEDFEHLLEQSKLDRVLIFKHSTQCPISDQVYEDFMHFAEEQAPTLHCGVILVIETRRLSNNIAERLGVKHHSPQAIMIRDGRAIWHASHWSITADSLSQALRTNGEPAHQRD